MNKLMIVLAVVSIAAVGCVSKSKYVELSDQYDAAQQDIKGKQGQIDDLNSKISELEMKIEELTRQASALEGLSQSSSAELKKALAELAALKADADARAAEMNNLLKQFKSLIDAGKLKVQMIDGRLVLQLPTDILFKPGKANLSKEGIEAIKEVATVLATLKKRFQVEGHTDNNPIKNRHFKNNWELAAARAQGVVDAMIEAGVPGESLSAASYGEFMPSDTNDTKEGRGNNRRINIVLVPDLSKLPGFSK
ncbi:MAG: OmpA family protein [Deltaproteobacteria bacterium]|nr:OmpA family protein [Deltaproteobacteria bacterium]MBN2672547.1 OmpA family protein [Deltaproteobacteria bacterium]